MPLNIPTDTSKIGPWAQELTNSCFTSLERRRQRGAAFRNLYLMGSEDGQPQTYRKTYAYIQTLSAMLYSPSELRFTVAPYGPSGPRERAMGRAAANHLYERFRNSVLDTLCEQAVEWGLVKGKTFIQLGWSRNGLEGNMVQPETIGVLREDITSLDRQDAFVHSAWLTEARFADHLYGNPRSREIMRQVKALLSRDEDLPTSSDAGRQVLIGGQLYPYRPANSTGSGQGRGIVNWLQAPTPELDADVQTDLIRLDELWVWDRNRDDWATIQVAGNVVIEPTFQLRNIFAEGHLSGAAKRRVSRGEDAGEHNPLAGHQPFIEICPNPLPDYFWGWSEVFNVALLQSAINARVDGINRLLRKQEDPSWLIAGANTTASRLKATLRRPGGYHVEPQAGNMKIERMSPDLPEGLWQSLHELIRLFDDAGGFPNIMLGQGESGVRAQGHAETLVRMASPRFKDRALEVERQIEEVGGLALDLMRAHDGEQYPYWLRESELGPFKGKELDPLLYEPPSPDVVAVGFLMNQLHDRFKVKVDSHSSSPIFSDENREVAGMLAKLGVPPEEVIRMLNIQREDEVLAAMDTAQANKARMIESLPPDARIAALTGQKPPKRSAAH